MALVPSVFVKYAANGSSTKSNELGMRAMQERAYEKRGEQYLLIKSPAGLVQEPRSDAHRARQTAQSGTASGHRRGAGEVHRVQLQR